MAPNPNPARITDPMWEFQAAVIALEPDDFELSGIYADKKGYHNTVNRNLERWPGEYSTRLKADLTGDRNKARGVDISSRSAKRGDYRRMAKYGNRLRAAYDRRDPRLSKWREVLGQADADAAPEGLDFQGWYTRVPDETHMWHFHFSILTQFANDREAYAAMLSVLIGETLQQYRQRTGGAVGAGDADFVAANVPLPGDANKVVGLHVATSSIWGLALALNAKADADEVRDKALQAAFDALKAQITAAGGNVDILPAVEAIKAVGEEARQKFGELNARLAEERAERLRAQQRVERLSSVLASAGITLGEADDPLPPIE